MDLKEILSISGMPGLYKIMASRDNGLIVTPLGEDKKRFVSSRQHMFTPLENITIYTHEDSESLVTILEKMKSEESKTPLVSPSASGAELRAYFTAILPNHDAEKVYNSDIKKIVKWFQQLDQNGLIPAEKKAKKKTSEKKPADEASATGKKKPAAKKTTSKKKK